MERGGRARLRPVLRARPPAEWAADQVPEVGYEDRLWSDGRFVYLGTERQFGTTPLRIDVLDSPPSEPDPVWQHAAEVSLDGDGPLEVFSWPGDDPVVSVPLPAGPVRLRAHWGGLGPDHLDEDSPEHLALVLWSAALAPPVVVRRWPTG